MEVVLSFLRDIRFTRAQTPTTRPHAARRASKQDRLAGELSDSVTSGKSWVCIVHPKNEKSEKQYQQQIQKCSRILFTTNVVAVF